MADNRYVADCPFCAIGRGEEIPAEVICEKESWIAFFPEDPATPGHTLVIPREHIENLWDSDDALASGLIEAVLLVGKAIRDALSPEGMNLITSDGRAAEQSVFHLHLHVVPRWHRDGFGRIWPTGDRYDEESLDGVADQIRTACGAVRSRADAQIAAPSHNDDEPVRD